MSNQLLSLFKKENPVSDFCDGIVADEAILFNMKLEKAGYKLTTYFIADLKRKWAIHRIDELRPSRFNNCPIRGKISFNSVNAKTKRSAAYLALLEIKNEFRNFQKRSKNNTEALSESKATEPSYYTEFKDLIDLINNEESTQAKDAIELVLKLNNEELENTILGKVGYNKSGRGHLYLKHDSILRSIIDDTKKINGNIWYFILFLLGHSNSRAAINLRNKITTLEFSRGEDLLHIPAEIKHYSNLMSLSFRGLHIDMLPEEIGELENLEILNLEFTKLKSIPSTIGNLKNLKELKLYSSELKVIPEEIYRLEGLDISGFISEDKDSRM